MLQELRIWAMPRNLCLYHLLAKFISLSCIIQLEEGSINALGCFANPKDEVLELVAMFTYSRKTSANIIMENKQVLASAEVN